MADAKVSALVELTPANITNGDWLYIVDTSAGSSGGKKIDADAFVWTQKASTIIDNTNFGIGTGNDLILFHDASDSWIRNITGDLNIDNNAHGKNTIFTNETAGGVDKTLLTLDPDSSVVRTPDDVKFSAGDSDDLLMYHSAAGLIVCNTGNFVLRQGAAISNGDIKIDNDSHGYNTVFTNEDAGGTDRTLLTLDPDDPGIQIGYGTIKIAEQAAANADTAGYGQLWVKNTTPCELWFTDDAGTDTQIV